MTLTIGEWILIGSIFLIGAAFAAWDFFDYKFATKAFGITATAITLAICLTLMFGLSWWHKNTASGERSIKDYHSDLDYGLEREVVITAEDGREIFRYSGKIDVETAHSGNANYILFESEDGRRYIIYYGVTDTVMIIEKEAKEQ